MRNMTTITVTRLFEELQTAIGEAYRANPEAMANIRNFQRDYSWDNPFATAVEADIKDERRWERNRPAGIPPARIPAATVALARILKWTADGALRRNGGRDLQPSDAFVMKPSAYMATVLGGMIAEHLPSTWFAEVDAINIMREKGRIGQSFPS